jgi:hypothetical protein
MRAMRTPKLVAVAALSAVVAVSADANAESIIKSPGDHPNYSVEIEPHVNFGWANRGFVGSAAFGLGARFSIPIVQNGFIPSINNSVAISFGLDYLRYGCNVRYFNDREYDCGASFLLFPVAMQWNFWFTPKFSVFGEPGLYVYHGFFDDVCGSDPRFRNGVVCSTPTKTSIDWMLHAGGRFHFNDTIALTLRVGYPTVSFGVSIFL